MDSSQVQHSKVDNRLTGWSMLLGVSLWFIDLNVVYALPSLACKWGWFPFTILGIPGLLVVEALITLASMLLMAFLIYLPWKNWRWFQSENTARNPQMLKDTEKDRRPLLAFIAMLLNGFFFLFMIASFVPILTLNACVRG